MAPAGAGTPVQVSSPLRYGLLGRGELAAALVVWRVVRFGAQLGDNFRPVCPCRRRTRPSSCRCMAELARSTWILQSPWPQRAPLTCKTEFKGPGNICDQGSRGTWGMDRPLGTQASKA